MSISKAISKNVSCFVRNLIGRLMRFFSRMNRSPIERRLMFPSLKSGVAKRLLPIYPLAPVTNIIVNNKYFPNKGTDMEVGGIISAKSKKNTVNERRIEMDKDTCKKKNNMS